LGAGVLLFAHWLYLIAAVLDMFADEPSNEEDNVHKRGQKMIDSSQKSVDSSLKMIDSAHLSTTTSSNQANPIAPSDSLTRVPMKRGSSPIGLTRQGSTLGSLNQRESVSLLQGLSSRRDNSKMPMSVQLADSFLQLQVQSHLNNLEDMSDDGEEMLHLIQA